MPTPVIDLRPDWTWQNWHGTRGVGGKVGRFYTPMNLWSDGSATPDKTFAPGLAALQSIVQSAERDGKRVRALGSGWSLSSIGYVEDDLVNTSRLTSWFIGFRTHTLVEPAMRGSVDRLVFAQCGLQIKTLNAYLERANLALPTSGASNGQTIAGAVSTGTHGSAHDVGSIQDFILGLHVVAEGGKHYWLEHPSRPTMTPAFAEWLGAELRRDEDLFLAALVGFGSFGLIHAVMFEAVPLYLLELFVKQLDVPEVLTAACSRDVRGLGLPDGDAMPFHFEVVLNPYRRGADEGGAFVRAMYKRVPQGPLPPAPPTEGLSILSRDLVSIAGHFSDAVPEAIPAVLQSQLMASVHPTAPGTILATPGIHFGDSQPTNGGTSVEIGVPLERTSDALRAIFQVTDRQPFGAPLALRYVRASEALLAFTCHAPTTCTIEMPGIDSDRARSAHAAIFTALREARIPVTYHWGQQGPFDATSLAGFGADRVNRWLSARRNFLSPEGRAMFSNALVDACGLST